MPHRSETDPVVIESPCDHVSEVKIKSVKRPGDGCVDCLKIGATWLHLRECLTCGHVACCDDSPNRHATKHNRATHHPIITSVEPGETWVWCFVDEEALSP
jgi:uncharacterized UBP type Zn finger protein